MKKSILKISLLISLSTLFSACGSHKPNHHSDTQSDKKPPMIKPKHNDKEKNITNWEGKECAYSICRPNNKNPKTITVEKSNAQKSDSEKDKITTISLSVGENKNTSDQKAYKITLLQENNINLAYYGYSTYSNKDHTNTRIKFLSGIHKNYINENQLPTNFTANYEGKNSFIYTNISNPKENHQAQYADITLNYNNGSITGSVTRTNDSKDIIFNVKKGENHFLLLTPTEKSDIPQDDLGIFDIKFIDSSQNNNDRKYIIGTGIGDDWMGAFSAEKKQ
ncbi:hypothetical protein K7G92_001543 [Pasteurella canis]|uniref:hypothetical protein n=1 Tax=Pasteurella canis TaxID=753 RepID=UPI001E403436|nr:hypothetical protein [Pasteurella canis]UEA16302.1 hypothetical protein K7G92_001543 [Pasteurella canis]